MKHLLLITAISFLTLNGLSQNVGIGTTIPKARLHVTDSSVLFSATGDIPGIQGLLPQEGPGRRMMWYPIKAAFRAGYVDGSQWNNANIGTYSMATGFGTTASQGYSTAFGFFSSARGVASTAMGNQTIAKALGSLSIGSLNDFTDNPDPFNANPTDRIFQIGNGAGFFPSNAMTVLRNGNVGFGINIPDEKLQITGNVRANNFVYTTPKTLYYSLSGNDFKAHVSTDTTTVSNGTGGIFMSNTISGKRIIAGVHLPHGATMVNMTVYINDLSASENLRALLYRKTILDNFFPNNLGFVTSTGSTGITTAYQTPVNSFDNLVNNNLYTYYISIAPESSTGVWSNFALELRAVVIEYTLSSAQ